MSPAGNFWEFSLRIYAMPGVEAASLDLQERFGADVNVALYCLWIGRALAEEALERVVETAAPLRQFIEPLRSMRRSATKGDGTYEALLKAELAAEKLEQEALAALAAPGAGGADAAKANLRRYSETLGVDTAAFMETAAPLIAAL